MNEYIIKMLGRDNESFSIKASTPDLAIEVFKCYGQCQKKKIYNIYAVYYETFADMVRQNLSLIEEFVP